jgi:hypothetical protein
VPELIDRAYLSQDSSLAGIVKAVAYAGDRLGVSVPGRIVDVIDESWALAGDASGAGRRPHIADRVICETAFSPPSRTARVKAASSRSWQEASFAPRAGG